MRKIVYMFLSIYIFFSAIACSDQVTNEVSDMQTVTLSLFNRDTVLRTVYPDSWTFGGASSTIAGLYFAVSAYTVENVGDTTPSGSYYRDTIDKSKFFTVVTYEQLQSEGLSLALTPGIWRITLSAYKSSITASSGGTVSNTDLVLTDTQYVTLGGGSKNRTVTFSLMTPETEVTGSFSTGLAFYPPDTFSELTCDLYRYSYVDNPDAGTKTGQIGTLVETVTYGKTDLESEATGITNFSTYYYVNGGVSFEVTSGTYLFVLSFFDVNNKIIARYPLALVVEAENTTTAEIVMHRVAFNSSPINCSALTVQNMSFNNGTDDIAISSGTTKAQKASLGLWQALESAESATNAFTATFTWNDNADNENGYYVEKCSSTDGSTWSAWTSLVTLPAGSKKYTGSFATGAQYKIRVKPFNDFSKANGNVTSGYDTYVESDSFGIFTITYNLVYTDNDSNSYNASVRTAADATTGNAVVQFVLPYVYGDSENNTLLSTFAGYPYIVPPAALFSHTLSWKSNGTTLSDIGGYAGGNMTATPVWTEN